MQQMFMASSTPTITYKGVIIHNGPVDLTRCTHIEKTYKNNLIPSILFQGLNVEWVYPDEETRTVAYERMANNAIIQEAFGYARTQIRQ